MTGKAFALQKREYTRKKSNAWKLQSHPLKEKDRITLKKTLINLGADNKRVNALIKEKQDNLTQMGKEKEYQYVLEELAKSLKNDLSFYTNNTYDSLLEDTGLEMIELGHIHAAVVNQNDYDEPLKGYAIFINLGTYYALQLLTKSLIVESFIDDFEVHKRDGREFIELAMEIYNTKSSLPPRELFWYEYPSEVQVQASSAQSVFSIKVLQFIALHELGHCTYGHFDINVSKYHELEFEADKFAFENLFTEDREPIANWSSLYPVFYFFVWLNAVEKKNNQTSSNLHPNLLIRAQRLREMMLKLTLNNDYGYEKHFDAIITYFEKWSKNDI